MAVTRTSPSAIWARKVEEIMEKSTDRGNLRSGLRRVRLPGTVASSGWSRASGGEHHGRLAGEPSGAPGAVVTAEPLARTPCTAQAMTTAC